MASTPYPLPRSTRRTDVLTGDGGTTYGPFGDGWGIFDTLDVAVWVKPLGAETFTRSTGFTASKVNPAAAYDNFTITFATALPASTQFYVEGARLPERSVAITRGGALSSTLLEKELSLIAMVQQELRRDADVTSGNQTMSDFAHEVLATTSAAALRALLGVSLVAAEADAIDVRDFGALADGLADDGPAISAAFAHARTLTGARPPVLIPAGDYRIATSINCTDIRAATDQGALRIIGLGARLLGQCTGKPVIDCTRSLQLQFEGITITGDAVATPLCAFQFARGNNAESADAMSLLFVTLKGSYSRAAVYNFASERFMAIGCIIRNYASGADKFGFIIDGQNYYGAASDYYTITAARYAAQSCLNHSFVSTSLGGGNAGSTNCPIQIINASRISMQGCYSISRGGRPGVEIGVYSSATAFAAFTLDLHMEAEGDLGSCFSFANLGTATSVTIDGFAWKENSLHGGSPVFNNGLSGQVILRDLDVRISGKKASATNVIFGSTSFTCSGKLAWAIAGTAPTGLNIDYFTGDIVAPDFAGVSLPTGGAYDTVAYSGGTPTVTHYGTHVFATAIQSSGPLIGYTTGGGGSVTQITSKSTAVTLDKASGIITLHGQSLAAGAIASFTFNNSLISTLSAIILHRRANGSAASYNVWVDSVVAGSAVICVKNISAGALAEAVILRFAVFNAAST